MELVELYHFSHPQHKLCMKQSNNTSFDCNGCFQSGTGPYFKCSQCTFKLHTHCAKIIQTGALCHPLYPKEYKFKFQQRPSLEKQQRPSGNSCYCNACGQDVGGFVYHCNKFGRYIHPCCAALPRVIKANDGVLVKLHREEAASCDFCRQKKRGWIYRSSCKTYKFHVTCVMKSWLKNKDEHFFVGDGSTSKMSTVSNCLTEGKRRKHDKSWIEKFQKYAFILVRGIIMAVLGLFPTPMLAVGAAALLPF